MKYYLYLIISLFAFNGSAQTFDFSVTSDTAFCNPQNNIAHCYSYVINPASEPLQIDIIRINQNIYPGWVSSMCVDTICYFISVDSVRVEIPPQSEIEFRPGFNLLNDTSNQVATVTYLIRDSNNPSNQLLFDTYGVNDWSITNTQDVLVDDQIIVYPNPSSQRIVVKTDLIVESAALISTGGHTIAQWHSTNQLDLSPLENGIYLLKIQTASGSAIKPIVKF